MNPRVPTADSAANVLSRDVIGNKTDTHSGNSIYAKVDTLVDHVHSACKTIPTMAAGVQVTAAAGAWTLGNYAVIAAANAITSAFDIHGINFDSITGNDVYELVIYAGADGAEVEVGRRRFNKINANNDNRELTFQTPLIAANTQIKAKLASAAGSNNVVMTIRYHTY